MEQPTLDVTRLSIRDTPDFLSLVPYLLGYQPQERLVFLVVEGCRLALTGALPLSALDEPDSPALVRTALDRFLEPRVLLACWSQDPERAERALGLAEVWLGADRVLDSVAVHPDRWRSRHAFGSGRGGSTQELASTPAVAAAVVAGLVALPSRDSAVAVVEGPGPDDEPARAWCLAAEQRLATQGWAPRDRHATALHARLLGQPSSATHEELAELAVLSADEFTRGRLWQQLDARSADRAVQLWARVLAQTPPEWAVPPLLVLGFSAWLAGSGAVLVASLERACRLGGWCRDLVLLDRLNREAVPPSAWERARARVTGDGDGCDVDGPRYCADSGPADGDGDDPAR